MASAHYKGNADIVYTPSGGSQTTHLLAVPLLISPRQGFAFSSRKRRWSAESGDGTVREVFVLGTEIQQVEVTARFEDDPSGLLAVLQASYWDDVQLTYRPDGTTEFPCYVWDVDKGPNGGIKLTPDRERWGAGEWEVGFTLRRTDGGTFEGLF